MEEKIKAIIVDDEQEAREGIKTLLEEEEDIKVVALCKNGIEAIDTLANFKIDLMFLDVQMPMVDGFEVVRSITESRMPAVIFITAYDQYAVKAFDVHAIDYLLKPFTDERFFEALRRAKNMIRNKKQEIQTKKIKNIVLGMVGTSNPGNDNLLIDSEYPGSGIGDKLLVKENGQVHFIDYKDIIWIEAFDYYVKIHVSNRFYMLRESMKKLAEKMSGKNFARIHKSSIVNFNYIQSIKGLGSGEYSIQLKSGNKLKVSRGFKESIRHLLK